MSKKALMLPVSVALSLVLSGCGTGQNAGPTTPKLAPNGGPSELPPKKGMFDTWTTYRTPDGSISFEYPSFLVKKDGEKTGTNDPDIIFLLQPANRDDIIGITFIMRTSKQDNTWWLDHMMDSRADDKTVPISKRKKIALGGAHGLRQEFLEASSPKTELIALDLAAPPIYLDMTVAYRVERKQELRPICEKIVDSLKFNAPEKR